MNQEQPLPETALTYAADLTLTLPAFGEPVVLQIRLLPADLIPTLDADESAVAYKPLRDCTLAEIQRFGDSLESEAWREHADLLLSDIVDLDGGAVRLASEQDEVDSSAETWHEAYILFEGESDAETASDEVAPVSEEDETAHEGLEPEVEAPTAEVELEHRVESQTMPDELESLPDIEEIPVVEITPPNRSDLPLIDQITIAEPEPIIEEREISEGGGATHVIRPRDMQNRIAGYVLPQDDPTPAAVDILFDEAPFKDAQNHSLTSLNREVAGFLIGPPPEKQPNGRYVVHVTDSIIAKHTRMHGASVTYTPESWRYVTDEMRSRYPNEECVIVGWYHTHPGFGIFLSNMDLFIHHNFFTQKWHIALVLDPVAKRSGFFTWNREQKDVMAYHFPWPYWAHSSW